MADIANIQVTAEVRNRFNHCRKVLGIRIGGKQTVDGALNIICGEWLGHQTDKVPAEVLREDKDEFEAKS